MNSIVADAWSLKKEQRARVRRELAEKYHVELRGAGFWARLWLRLRLEREVSAELKRRFPPGALYGASV